MEDSGRGVYMFPAQIPRTGSDELKGGRDSNQSMLEERGGSKEDIRADTALSHEVERALWNDDVVRAIEYDQIDVHVKNGVIHLTGHIVNTSSQNRIMNAIRSIPGILIIDNKLVVDEKLTLEVANALATLEHMHDCKFFTGASHGVLSINGVVSNEEVKMLAEKCAASNPNVRGVVNYVRVSGSERELQDQPFLQPAVGKTIYFLDGIPGVVKQVIINPNNRRVIAMTVQGNFNGLHPLTNETAKPSGQLIVIPMNAVRYLTKASGFLHIKSNERNQYEDFDPASFFMPDLGWKPPYPYCPDDVLFPVEYQAEDMQIEYGPLQFSFKEILEGVSFKEQFFANDSLGG